LKTDKTTTRYRLHLQTEILDNGRHEAYHSVFEWQEFVQGIGGGFMGLYVCREKFFQSCISMWSHEYGEKEKNKKKLNKIK